MALQLVRTGVHLGWALGTITTNDPHNHIHHIKLVLTFLSFGGFSDSTSPFQIQSFSFLLQAYSFQGPKELSSYFSFVVPKQSISDPRATSNLLFLNFFPLLTFITLLSPVCVLSFAWFWCFLLFLIPS